MNEQIEENVVNIRDFQEGDELTIHHMNSESESIKEWTTTMKVGGVFTYEHVRDGEVIDTWVEPNLVVDEGLNYILDSAMSGATTLTTWYISLFKNNYTPIFSDTAAAFPGAGVANEATTEYTEANRPTWVEAGVTSKTITNTLSPAVFTFGTPITIYGAFLVSTNVKGGTTGKLAAASKFTSSRAMLANDVLNVTYTLTISSV
ncbi:hypothetical protein [Caudoviricetes sp.]|nr:hypothetical protein [Caudoviricetes sp.]